MKKLLLILLAAVLLAGCSSKDKPSTSDPKSDTPESEPTQEPAPEDNKLTFGSTFSFDGFDITISDAVEWSTLNNQFSDKNGADVFLVPFHIKNNSGETGMLNMFYVKYFGSQGVSLDDVSSYFDDSFGFSSDELRDGAETDSKFAIMYDGDGDYYIEFNNFSEKLEVVLPITK